MKIAARKKWDAHEVGTKLEAFAIAGCDPLSMYQHFCSVSNMNSLYADLLNTSKKKADYLKSQICDKFHSNLGKTPS